MSTAWIGSGTEIVYVEDREEESNFRFYIVNGQEKFITRVTHTKQIELLYHCIYMAQVQDDDIKDIIDAGFTYFKDVEDLIAHQEEEK